MDENLNSFFELVNISSHKNHVLPYGVQFICYCICLDSNIEKFGFSFDGKVFVKTGKSLLGITINKGKRLDRR